jgi:hypothetical protein
MVLRRFSMERILKRAKSLGALFLAVVLLAQCGTEAEDGVADTPDYRTVLTAGGGITVPAGDTAKEISFTGARGLKLSKADFGVTGGGAVGGVSVADDNVTITVTFKPNESSSAKVYNVVVASISTIARGDASVKIIHLGTDGSEDPRIVLTVGGPVEVSAEVQTVTVTFTAGEALTFTPEPGDFTVAGGGTVSEVNVDGDTVTVTVDFPKNNTNSPRNYTVSIAKDSEIVRGSGSVTITQWGADLQASTLYVSKDGNDENDGLSSTTPFATLAHAYAAALTDYPGVDTITVLSDLDAGNSPMTLDGGGKTVPEITITGNGRLLRTSENSSENVSPYYGSSVVKVIGGAEVTFSNIKIDGTSSFHRALYIEGAKVTLEAGAHLVGRVIYYHINGSSSRGGGVYITTNGALTMEAGSKIEGEAITLYNCQYLFLSGGGVYLDKNGTFTMNGGTVSGTAAYGGGVFSDGEFTMDGGEISGSTNPTMNITPSYGGGVYVGSGGEFTMSNGIISGNTAMGNGGGVYVDGNGTFNMTSGTIYGSNEFGNDASGKLLKNTAKAKSDDRGDAYRTSGGQYSNDTTYKYPAD